MIRNIIPKSFIPELDSFNAPNSEKIVIRNPKTPVIILGINFLFLINTTRLIKENIKKATAIIIIINAASNAFSVPCARKTLVFNKAKKSNSPLFIILVVNRIN